MAVNVTKIKTAQFLDCWAYFPSAISACLFLSILFSPSLAKTLVDRQITVVEENPVKVDTINLKPSIVGALRVDIKPYVPRNHWLIYEIQLVDKNGQVVASAMDEAWQESGIWREGNESGTWSESDTLGGIDIRSLEAEELDIVVEVLESGTASGQTADLAVSFDVKIQNGVIKSSDLWWGLLFSTGLAIMALLVTTMSGRKVISKKIGDSDPQGRANIGGKDRLVRVKIKTKLDENTPNLIKICLSIDNAYGERVCNFKVSTPVFLTKDNNSRVTGGVGRLECYLLLEPYDIYRFKVSVEPDYPIDWTSLVVRDNAKTLKAVNAVKITSNLSSQP